MLQVGFPLGSLLMNLMKPHQKLQTIVMNMTPLHCSQLLNIMELSAYLEFLLKLVFE